jgi:hypothetical protein
MAIRVNAKVRGLGQRYRDGLEMMSVDVNKAEAEGLPFAEGRRVPITLLIGGEAYAAGMRTTPRMTLVWISPDLVGPGEERTKLARVLDRNGFQKNQAVFLYVDGDRIRLEPASR